MDMAEYVKSGFHSFLNDIEQVHTADMILTEFCDISVTWMKINFWISIANTFVVIQYIPTGGPWVIRISVSIGIFSHFSKIFLPRSTLKPQPQNSGCLKTQPSFSDQFKRLSKWLVPRWPVNFVPTNIYGRILKINAVSQQLLHMINPKFTEVSC